MKGEIGKMYYRTHFRKWELSPYRPESFDGIVKNKLPGKLFFFSTHQKFLCIVRTCFVQRGVAIYR